MHATSALLECQRAFLAALYDERRAGAARWVAGNGLSAEARLRIYRHRSEDVHTDALRTTFPAVLALVGDAFFVNIAHGYRRVHPSRSGNLQGFGIDFADHLAALPETRTLPYLPDVARLEWLRQEAALAAAEVPKPSVAFDGGTAPRDTIPYVALQPSVRLLASPHAVLTIWRHAMSPTEDRPVSPACGENVVLWREGGEVAMAELDAASFACTCTLARGHSLATASAAGRALDPEFDPDACLASLAAHRLIAANVRVIRQGLLQPC